MQPSNIICLTEQELEDIAGGLTWAEGFLAGVNPVAALAVLVGFGVGLACNYQQYCAGVSAGYDYAAIH